MFESHIYMRGRQSDESEKYLNRMSQRWDTPNYHENREERGYLRVLKSESVRGQFSEYSSVEYSNAGEFT